MVGGVGEWVGGVGEWVGGVGEWVGGEGGWRVRGMVGRKRERNNYISQNF